MLIHIGAFPGCLVNEFTQAAKKKQGEEGSPSPVGSFVILDKNVPQFSLDASYLTNSFGSIKVDFVSERHSQKAISHRMHFNPIQQLHLRPWLLQTSDLTTIPQFHAA